MVVVFPFSLHILQKASTPFIAETVPIYFHTHDVRLPPFLWLVGALFFGFFSPLGPRLGMLLKSRRGLGASRSMPWSSRILSSSFDSCEFPPYFKSSSGPASSASSSTRPAASCIKEVIYVSALI